MKSIKATPSKGLKSKFIKILKSKISTRKTRGRHFAHCRTTIKKITLERAANITLISHDKFANSSILLSLKLMCLLTIRQEIYILAISVVDFFLKRRKWIGVPIKNHQSFKKIIRIHQYYKMLVVMPAIYVGQWRRKIIYNTGFHNK
jgi:hypothetical protein